MRILVVDNDLGARMILERVLSRFGEVDACGDGPGAVHAFHWALSNRTPYHLVCLETAMPLMNGIEALRRMRGLEAQFDYTNRKPARMIMTTASGDEETVTRAFEEHCDACVVKPINAADLLDLVQCLCGAGSSTAPAPRSYAGYAPAM